MKMLPLGTLLAVFLLGTGCERTTSPTESAGEPVATAVQSEENALPNPVAILKPDLHTRAMAPARNAQRRALFGDLHIHTRYSFDAFAFGTIATPADAYRYARGEAIRHPAGFEMKLPAPLDFLGVTDHAMFLGVAAEAANTGSEFSKLSMVEPLHNLNAPENRTPTSFGNRARIFASLIPNVAQGIVSGEIPREMVNDVVRSAWADIIDAARTYNDPGTFTTFVAYEYTTSTDERGNLHRNVIFRSGDRVPLIPFSRLHSQNPEGLWDWMDELRAQGIDSVAIPHNSNGSDGAMFMFTDWAGNPIDSIYATQRLRNEPLVEVTQVKGTSDTHPLLSPNDEWADFEIMPFKVGVAEPSREDGSYVRQAYLRGLKIEAETGANPYKFGLIGSSDTHTAAGSFEENNYFAKIGLLDATPALRGSVPLSEEEQQQARDAGIQQSLKEAGGAVYRDGAQQTWGASGLAGVWAEENTRESIFNAFRRKETFATSGPRMQVRLFAGYGFPADLPAREDWARQAYARGVTMGGDLYGRGKEPPQFVLWAARDAMSAPLQRLQIIKGALVDGEMQEKVFDVACSDGLAVDPVTHRCPDNGARVDLNDCSFPEDVGAGELAGVWQDPEFDPTAPAFYYVRALENPTCRWSTWDAIRNGTAPRPDLPATIQERAWSSPIWYVPGG